MTALVIPSASSPVVDPKSGLITRAWLRLFSGIAQAQNNAGGTGSPPVTIDVSRSPFIYAPGQAGTLLMSGGGVTSLWLARQNIFTPVGNFYAPLPLLADDAVRITYVRAPALTFLPS